MDVLLPKDPREENNTSTTPTMEGERLSGDSSISQQGQQKGDGEKREGSISGGKESEIGAEVKQSEGGEAAAATATSAQTGKGKHASGRKPRTKGLIKKLQEQVIMIYLWRQGMHNFF